ncbi:MAG: hypothetical protein H6978_08030 [Gammaproteobacteria bacterium]|nr:hypothetical protein [Gammaproteobacteria bacterium]
MAGYNNAGLPLQCKSTTLLVAILTACLCKPAAAHHSPAAYDTSKEITITGTIRDVSWGNPHIYIMLDVADGDDGQTKRVRVEAGSSSTVRPLGVSGSDFPIGEVIQVRGFASRRGSEAVMGLDVTNASGAILPLHIRGRVKAAEPIAKATELSGKWISETSSFLAYLASMPKWPYTEAMARALADRDTQLAAQADCTPAGPPASVLLPTLIEIETNNDAVVMNIDWMDSHRTIRLNSTHPSEIAPTLFGDAIGTWDGETLVIDTIGFTDDPEGMAPGRPTSAQKHLIERLTLNPDGTSLQYDVTMEDPVYLKQPVTHSGRWLYRPDAVVSGEPCDDTVAKEFLKY